MKRAGIKDVLHKEALSCMFVRPTVAHIAHLPLQELRLAASPHSRLVHLPLLRLSCIIFIAHSFAHDDSKSPSGWPRNVNEEYENVSNEK